MPLTINPRGQPGVTCRNYFSDSANGVQETVSAAKQHAGNTCCFAVIARVTSRVTARVSAREAFGVQINSLLPLGDLQ